MSKRTLSLWPTLGREPIVDFGIFGVETVRRRSPRTGREGAYRVVHAPDWVNVIALTPDEELVLVEQFRHGVDRLTLEIPGGAVDPGEAPAVAAARELSEETGYEGETPALLGRVTANPAIQTNACSTWLIRNARPVAEPRPDDGEDLAIRRVGRRQLDELVRTGAIDHSLVIAALFWWRQAESGDPTGGTMPGR